MRFTRERTIVFLFKPSLMRNVKGGKNEKVKKKKNVNNCNNSHRSRTDLRRTSQREHKRSLDL